MGYFLLNASALSSTLCLQFEICRITITWVLKVWVQNYSSIRFHLDIPIELVSQESIYSFLMYATQWVYILKETNKAVWSQEQGRFVNVYFTHKHKAHHQRNVTFILVLEPLYSSMYSKLLPTSVKWKFISFINCKNDVNIKKKIRACVSAAIPRTRSSWNSLLLPIFSSPIWHLAEKHITDPKKDELNYRKI